MLFSSISFLYYFLPIVLGLYFLVPFRLKNTVLLVASLFFYFYGEPVYSVLMVAASVSGYLHGLWIDKAKGRRYAKIPLISSLVFGLGLLVFFKYTDFFIENVNWLFGAGIGPLRLALPIGISFYTFQILSYTIDVYRGEAAVQRNLFDFMTYVSLFPQLIAGPIVRYTTVEKELAERKHSIENCAYGIHRFITGLSKKVLLANTLGELVKSLGQVHEKSIMLYWLVAVAFMFQIYFDFSGYSDMAIGLGRIFGFHFLENFNYPFISRDLTEFWRRWHISLGTWFRDYVYIPMGGSRVNTIKWVRNILVVWFLTGFWHGAQWNFILWGLYFGVFLIIEKCFLRKFLNQLPHAVQHLYTLFFITVSFVLFNAEGMGECIENFKGMFGLNHIPLTGPETAYYLKSYGLVLVIAAISSTPLVKDLIGKIRSHRIGLRILNILEPLVYILLLLLITGYLIDGSFNPFLYFRF